jgi:hypothetical protein
MGKTELLELGEKTMAACKESGEHVGSTPVVLPCQPCRMCALATDWGSNFFGLGCAGDAGVTKLSELKTALAL